MKGFPHVPASFINALREEGTKAEACDFLQKTWNELCAVKAALVKPLVWGTTSYGSPEALSVAGTYRISDAWDGGFNVNRGNLSFQSEDGRKNFPTITEAKAAAQADFEQRILSTLATGGTNA